eukprot:1893242-Prymnesium_polylepis.1
MCRPSGAGRDGLSVSCDNVASIHYTCYTERGLHASVFPGGNQHHTYIPYRHARCHPRRLNQRSLVARRASPRQRMPLPPLPLPPQAARSSRSATPPARGRAQRTAHGSTPHRMWDTRM